MSTPIQEYIDVAVTVGDRLVQSANLNVILVFSLFTVPTGWTGSGVTGQRIAEYTAPADMLTDGFLATSKEYKAASALLTARSVSRIKVGRADVADANISASLGAIEGADADFYGIVSTHRQEADINAIAAWTEGGSYKHIYFGSSEDAGVLVASTTTDIASDLHGANYNRTAYLWHWESGFDHATGNAIAVATLIATVTHTAHGVRAGDTVVIAGVGGGPTGFALLNGEKTVLTVPTADTYTYAAPGVSDASATGTIVIYGRYKFPEARWLSYGLSAAVGEETYHAKPLTGQTPVPTTNMSLTQQHNAKAKNANIYTNVGGVAVTQEGVMASGRFIDIQIGMDWLELRIAEALWQRVVNSKKIPFIQEGINTMIADIQGVTDEGVRRTLLGPLVDSKSGETARIVAPRIEDVSASDKISRTLPPFVVTVQFQGAIVRMSVDVNALI